MGNDALTRDLAVIGGTGFLGRHFVAAARRLGRRVRMLVRETAAARGGAINGAINGVADRRRGRRRDRRRRDRICPGRSRDAAALTRLITPGATVVNFAWSGTTAPADAVRQARQLAAACREARAHALLHCSTAAVFGACGGASVITDETAPRPADSYGRVKLAVDDMLRQELEGRVPLALLRPASVFGAGGEGLVKLIAEIASGGGLASYLRSCLFDRRLLHLVPVETVVEAFLFVEARVGSSGSRHLITHLITADDEPLNQYRAMERRLMQLFDVPDHRWPRVPMPPAALRVALRAGQRVASLPFTPFDDGGLRALGFRPPVAFDAAVESFAAWYRARAGVAPHRRATGAGVVTTPHASLEGRPLVSIVIPTYNRAAYLGEAIESVLAQDYAPIELIVIDDGSTDDTQAVLKRYAGRCLCEVQENQGQSRTLNRGWQLARGEIVGYLGDDDCLRPGAVAALVRALMADRDAVMAYGDYSLIDSASRVIRQIVFRPRPYVEMVRDLRVMPGPGALHRRAALMAAGPWDPEFRLTPDLDFYLRLGLLGRFVHVPGELAAFRVHESSATFRPADPQVVEEPLRVARRFFARGDLPPEIRAAERSASAYAALMLARGHMRAHRFGAAARSLRLALQLRVARAVPVVWLPPDVQRRRQSSLLPDAVAPALVEGVAMKVLIVSHLLAREIGGGVMMRSIAVARALVREGLDVHLLGTDTGMTPADVRPSRGPAGHAGAQRTATVRRAASRRGTGVAARARCGRGAAVQSLDAAERIGVSGRTQARRAACHLPIRRADLGHAIAPDQTRLPGHRRRASHPRGRALRRDDRAGADGRRGVRRAGQIGWT